MAVISSNAVANGSAPTPRRFSYDPRRDVFLTGRDRIARDLADFWFDRLRDMYQEARRMGFKHREGEFMYFRRILAFCFAREG